MKVSMKILSVIIENEGITTPELCKIIQRKRNVTHELCGFLISRGLVIRKFAEKTGNRGRPAMKWYIREPAREKAIRKIKEDIERENDSSNGNNQSPEQN